MNKKEDVFFIRLFKFGSMNYLYKILFASLFSFTLCLDSDGDGYSDDAENYMSTDPNDASSVIYKGGWPFNIEKDGKHDPGFGNRECDELPYGNGCACSSDDDCNPDAHCLTLMMDAACVPRLGAQLPRFTAIDQYGDEFDIYDLVGQGKPIILEIGTQWCRPCKLVSEWLSSDSKVIFDDISDEPWWKPEYTKVKEIINDGGAYWVTAFHQNAYREEITPDDVEDWHDSYPHDNVILLTDPEERMKLWVRPTAYPTLVFLDDELQLRAHTLRGVKEAWEMLLQYHEGSDAGK